MVRHMGWCDHANALPITTCKVLLYSHDVSKTISMKSWALLMFTFFLQCLPHCSLQWPHASRDYLPSYNVIWALLDPAMIFQFLGCGSFIRLDTKFIGNWGKSASWSMKKCIFPAMLKLHTYTPDVACNICFAGHCIFGLIGRDKCAQE